MEKRELEKKERLLIALEKGMVMIHLDARKAGVVVPPQLRNEAHLRLNLSYKFDPPDLSVGEWGVRSTLSFPNCGRFTVAVPWSALFAITSHVTREFWMYPGDIPPELIEGSTMASRPPPPASPEPNDSPRVILREVALEPREPAEEKAEEEPPRPRGRGHLRVVK